MMKNIKRQILAMLFAVVAAVSTICFLCGTNADTAIAEAYDIQFDSLFADEFALGERVVLPAGKILYGERLIVPETTCVRYPDGRIHNGETHVLNIAGEYSVICTARVDGKTVRGERKIKAVQSAYTVSSERSTVEYSDDAKTTAVAEDKAIKVGLAEGDSFQYNRVVNLSGSNRTVPVIKYAPYANSVRARGVENVNVDAMYSVVRITDIYDENNFIEVTVGYYVTNQATGRLQQYALASAGTQQKTGLYKNTSGKVYGTRRLVVIDDEQYTVYYGLNDFGAMLDTRSGTFKDPDGSAVYKKDGVHISNADDFGYSVYYEESTGRIYIKHQTEHFITDLDEQVIVDNNKFGGFTTGEVRISLSFNTYKESVAYAEIFSIYGLEGEALKDFKVTDETAPEITLEKDIDNFYIAKGESFVLPEATASDLNLAGGVEKYVYYGYGMANQVSVSLKNDRFTPDREGVYSIVYIAKDAYGNTAKKVINAVCITCENGKTTNLTVEKTLNAKAGETVTLAAPLTNGVNKGRYCNAYAACDKERVTIRDNRFMPEYAGKYLITYEFGDEVNDYSYSYEMNVASSTAINVERVTLPRTFIKNAVYTLDAVYAKTYTGKSPRLSPASVSVSEDGGEYKDVDYNAYKVTADNSVSFRYSYSGVELYRSENIPVCDVGFGAALRMQDYFSGNFVKTATNNYVGLRSLATEGNNNLEFVNCLSFVNFFLNYEIPKDMAGMNKTDIVLTDYYNRQNAIRFSYIKKGSNTALYENGRLISEKKADFAANITIMYDAEKKAFTDTLGNVIYMQNPFESDKILLDVELGEIDGTAGIRIYKLCNQMLSSMTSDQFAPMIIREKVSGEMARHSVITVKPSCYIDVLSPYLKENNKFGVSFTERGANYKPARSDSGELLAEGADTEKSYRLTLSDYGVYTIQYSYTDQSGMQNEFADFVYVRDREAPTVAVIGKSNKTIESAELGVITLGEYIVKDNITKQSKIKVTVFAIAEDGELIICEDLQFEARRRGKYTVYYYAVDEQNNFAVAYYTIVVR